MNRIKLALAALVATVAVPTLAFAAESWEKVKGPAADEVPAGPFVGIAYGFIWIAILAYVVYVARGLARVRGELEDLRRKLDTAGKR